MIERKTLEYLADKLTNIPLIINHELGEISKTIQQLESDGLLKKYGIRVYARLRGGEAVQDMSPYDPLNQRRYFFADKTDALTWANLLKKYLKIESFSIE